jgi:dienelactone hydrolase
MMRAVHAVAGFVGRWLGPALLVFAAVLLVFPPSPFGDASRTMALAGGVITAIAAAFMRAPERRRLRRMFAVAALAGLAFGGWRYWAQNSGYHEQTVRFDNRGAQLVGTLYLPDRAAKVPGIVWVHGSGAEPRALFAPFAGHFARSGYAVLLYDKRGAGESGGAFVGGEQAIAADNIDLLASDASAALSFLARRPEVRRDAVGFVGASQAGWITPRAAVQNGHAAFMLLLSGPTTSAHAQLRYERFHISGGRAPSSRPQPAQVFKAFGRGDIPDGMTADQADVAAQQIPQAFSFPDYDPMADLRVLDIPGLWLLGDRDWMVPSGPTARNIEALRQLGKPYQYRSIPGAWHAMAIGPKGLVLTTIDGWLAQVTAAKQPAEP